MAKKAAPSAPAKPGSWSATSLPRVILIAGPESTLREEAIQAVRRAAFKGEADPGTNWVVLHGPASQNESDSLTPATVLDEACTRSMFAADDELKVVLVRQGDIFLSKHYKVFEENLDHIPDTTTLVLESAQFGKLKTTNFYKTLAAASAVVECDALANEYSHNAELELEVEKRAKARGLALQHGALIALMNRSSKSLSVLEEELDKLAVALRPPGEAPDVGAPVPVREEDILAYCAATNTFTAFQFVDALLDKEAKRALESLGGIFDRGLTDAKKPGRPITQEGSIAMMLLGSLTWKLSTLQDLKAGLDAGKSEGQVFSDAKIFGQRADGFRRTLRKHTGGTLRRCMDALFTAYLDLRRSGQGPREVLEQMAFKML